jgi:hypothetical protein
MKKEYPLRPYKTLESKDGMIALTLTEGIHRGIIFSYNKVSFTEDEVNDNLTLHFEYIIHDASGVIFDKEEFEAELGAFLTELIVSGIQDNSIIYAGGTE